MKLLIDMTAIKEAQELINAKVTDVTAIKKYICDHLNVTDIDTVALIAIRNDKQKQGLESFIRYIKAIGIDYEICNCPIMILNNKLTTHRCTNKIAYAIGLCARTQQDIVVVTDDPNIIDVADTYTHRTGRNVHIAFFKMAITCQLHSHRNFLDITNTEDVFGYEPQNLLPTGFANL